MSEFYSKQSVRVNTASASRRGGVFWGVDGQADWCSSTAAAVPVRCGEGAEPEDKAFNLLVHLLTDPHLWS